MRAKFWNATLMVALLLATLGPTPLARADDTPPPATVAIPGTLQSELGCSGDWMPDCDKTFLTYDAEDDVWQGVFEVQPDNDQDKKGPRYKAALNGSWGENYGKNASPGGADIPLAVIQPTLVKFYYDHKTHWVADSFNQVIATATGTFQSELGCKQDNDPGCLRSWMQDSQGSGLLFFTSTVIPPGDYEVKVDINESTDETYGAAGEKGGAAIPFTVKEDGAGVYIGFNTTTHEIVVSTQGAPKGNLSKQQAHWVSRDTILWNIVGSPKYTYALYYSPEATLALDTTGITGGAEIPLAYSKSGPGGDLFKKFPHLSGHTALKLNPDDLPKLPEILKGQMAVTVRDSTGKLVDAAGVQIPGVLDDLYDYTGPLGVSYGQGHLAPTLRVWAPTAQSVTLHLFDTAKASYAQKLPMALDGATGVWSIGGQPDWKGKFYLYEVQVFVPATGKIETNLVTDPYSLSLSTNSQRSQIVALTDAALKPPGWDTLAKPTLAAPEDAVIYELHIRDFSISDPSVPAELRGTYQAFTVKDSNGMKHLAALAQAGLTHIHLLPAFDIASVNEDKSTWQSVDEAALAALPPESDQQAAAVSLIKGTDGFNWGYDPLHYTAPDGSYATDPDGTPRITQFRNMVQALNETGLRVVMDVVYNHTNASGQSDNSVLDKVVPGYYHRLNADGNVEKSTCCENTATEHEMMRKLMIDSVLTWAKDYKVDGFRFDLMGHHLLADMQAVRAALDSLTLENDGVDGKAVYIYGEGWDFGEVANNARGKNATQLNIGGTGIGVFNDRLRDAVRGGSPFSDPREQGFATGLLFVNNANEQRPLEDQQTRFDEYTDWIRLGLAGNLASYQLVRADGNTVPGRLISYNQAPAGYTADPQENIIYVSAHDNETLFDAVQVKAPAEATLADRIRMNNLALSLAMFSQGVPFFHAGDDILRSKSLDRNSYDSGDWFNKLDWTYQSNNWGVGLPIEGSNYADIFRPLLADPALKPTPSDIEGAAAYFRELLQIRKSSPLFRLQTAEQVQSGLSFYNTGPAQIPGLIVMRLTDVDGLDENYSDLVVLFNSAPGGVTFAEDSFKGLALELHPVQQNSADAVVKTAAFDVANGAFTVPERTAAVFVAKQAALVTTAIPTLAATATATPAPELPAAPPPTLLLVLGGLLLAALAGLFWWRRGAKK